MKITAYFLSSFLSITSFLTLNISPVSAAIISGQAQSNNRTVFVHLFEWKWTDIAQECEQFLGPKGYAAVQVSPPQEHRIVAGFPWYQRYQAVSYQLESRSGTRQEFIEMVNRCQVAGVHIYVDAVINHTTGVLEPSTREKGSAGSAFGHFDYPLFKQAEFHYCNRHGNNEIQNWQDRWEVQNCELLNLADLKTELESVRLKIAAYLNDLVNLGVKGFRIDAAKHIPVTDLQAIFRQVKGKPFIYQEVIATQGEPIQPREYFSTGAVTEFQYGRLIAEIFRRGKLADLKNLTVQGMIPSRKAVVFINNHDNQRGHGDASPVLTFKDGQLHHLATLFMLAFPYGYPQIMSSYAFENDAQGPPSDAEGNTQNIYNNGKVNCFQEWICEHRIPAIANLVGFRNYTASDFRISHWWTNGNNQIAFARGRRGFIAINREETTLNQKLKTNLSPGIYCNITTGQLTENRKRCTGNTVTVDRQGMANINVPAMNAVAIYGGQKIQ